MNKVEKLKNKLMLLNDNQLDIIDSLINSWQPKQNNIETSEDTVKKIYENTISSIEDPLKNYSKEELLDEYGVLFYNQNEENNIEEINIQYNFEDKKNNHEDKYNNLDISALISNKPTSSNEKNLNIDDFDPLFPDTDFDLLTDISDSKYDDLDFSALISNKTK
ncbi:hypothetical protein O3802_01180 [Gemella sp. 27098_8_92]|uniref:hypothetical protein n=1 Tax=Gemella sp. 27098_8_92 TaxID=3003687 RepID=UPI00352F5D70